MQENSQVVWRHDCHSQLFDALRATSNARARPMVVQRGCVSSADTLPPETDAPLRQRHHPPRHEEEGHCILCHHWRSLGVWVLWRNKFYSLWLHLVPDGSPRAVSDEKHGEWLQNSHGGLPAKIVYSRKARIETLWPRWAKPWSRQLPKPIRLLNRIILQLPLRNSYFRLVESAIPDSCTISCQCLHPCRERIRIWWHRQEEVCGLHRGPQQSCRPLHRPKYYPQVVSDQTCRRFQRPRLQRYFRGLEHRRAAHLRRVLRHFPFCLRHLHLQHKNTRAEERRIVRQKEIKGDPRLQPVVQCMRKLSSFHAGLQCLAVQKGQLAPQRPPQNLTTHFNSNTL